jgi:cell volume regulation protein A
VLLTLLPVRLPLADKTFLSWGGLRGAAPIVLATFPALAGIPRAESIFNVVFFVVLASVLLQGTTARFAARALKVEAPPEERNGDVEPKHLANLASGLREIILPPAGAAIGRSLVELDLPAGFLVVLIDRAGESLVPDGDTVLEAGDHLLVLAAPPLFDQISQRLTSAAA